MDNLTGGSTPAYAYNYSLERSFSPFDVTHRFVGNVLYSLPIGKGGMILNNDNMASRLIGGWQVNGILTLETGTPFTVTAPDESGTGANHASRASCIGNAFAGASTDPSQIAGGQLLDFSSIRPRLRFRLSARSARARRARFTGLDWKTSI